MSTRIASLLASAALLAAAAPALAQDNRYGMHTDSGDRIEWQQREVVQQIDYEGDAETMIHEDDRDTVYRRGHRRDMHRQHPTQHRDTAPRLAYSQDEREAWLADCRIVMGGGDYYEDAEYVDDDRGNGSLLGGLLGAVVGGVAGNRIGGSGDRLAGTLIGAGVGGIAGAILGGAISNAAGEDDDYERRGRGSSDAAYAADYCDAYLRRYEASGSTGQMAYAQPVVLAAAPAPRGGMREVITEEWVEVADEPDRRPHRVVAPARVAPEQGKRTRIR